METRCNRHVFNKVLTLCTLTIGVMGSTQEEEEEAIEISQDEIDALRVQDVTLLPTNRCGR